MTIFNGPVVPFRALRAARDPQPFKMAKNGKAAEVYIYDTIGAGFFEDGVTAKRFADDLKKMEPFDTLTIYINSPGGSVFEGVAIGNIIARQKAKKIVHIDGLAASIASVIAMAGDEIRIASNGMMMIHDPWTVALGSATELRKTADTLDKIRDTILGSYVDRSGADRDKLSDMMAAETWLTAEEAVELGLADSVVEAADVAAFANFDLSLFKNAPKTITKSLADDYADAMMAGATAPRQTSARTPHPAVIRANARVAKLRASQ